jgi:hypothetical protein
MAATIQRATDIHLRILAERAEDALARRNAWQDALQRHAPQLARAVKFASSYAAYRQLRTNSLRG